MDDHLHIERRNETPSPAASPSLLGSGLLLVLAALLLPAAAQGQQRMFMPKIAGYEGSIEVDARHGRNIYGTGNRTSENRHTVLTEKMRINSYGYVYHPRFIAFRLGAAGGLRQERQTAAAASGAPSSTEGRDSEYDFRIFILPEHPYNLELYTRRSRPYFRSFTGQNMNPLIADKGALFNYKSRPLTLSADYQISSKTVEGVRDDTRVKSASGTQIWGASSTSFGARESDTVAPGERSLRENLFASNHLTFPGILRLQSRIALDREDQEETDGSFWERKVSWTENLQISLPWNFDSAMSYDETRSILETESALLPEPSREDFMSSNAALRLSHRLYNSLTTGYSRIYRVQESLRGLSRTEGNQVNAVYRKSTPLGMLILGADGSRSVTDSRGATSVVDTFQRRVGGTYRLTQQGADIGSIVLRVREPSTGIFRTMVRDTHYIIRELPPDTIEIEILALLPFAHDLFFDYDFHITYSVVPAEYEIRTTRHGHNLRMDMLKGLLSPYYRYDFSKQELLSGALPGDPLTTRSETIGISSLMEPYSLSADYQSVLSERNSYRSLGAEGRYLDTVAAGTVFESSLSRRRFMYLRESAGSAGSEYAYSVTTLNAKLKRNVPQTRLSLHTSAVVSSRSGFVDTWQYALAGGVTWRKDRFEIEAGASLSHSESSSSAGRQEQRSQYYFASVKRKLF